jgi:hypothetical protein
MRGCDGVESVGQCEGDMLVESLGVKDGEDGGSDSLNCSTLLLELTELIGVTNGWRLF